ncbi:hypothetical protein PT974_03692 [Cladobotryum mycophilum]|uniref:Uncharacterized protein n=1 Tax=Cladobotryum mycophilum TaxID=491253 RepID=A0ABR0ST05_9HYPO
MAVTTAISDFFHSIYEVIASLLGAVYSLLNNTINAIVNFLTGILTLVREVFGGLIDIAGGVGKFLAGNAVLLSIVAVGAVAYSRYSTHGRVTSSRKKTN